MASLCLLVSLMLVWSVEIEALSVRSLQDTTSSSKPNEQQDSLHRDFWQKPGCHLSGYTRTISIEGCVKFNLSANACRGYCVSFSIPITEDLVTSLSDGNQYSSYLTYDPSAASSSEFDMLPLSDKSYKLVAENPLYEPLSLAESAHIVGRPLQDSHGKEIVSVNQCCTMSESKLTKVQVLCTDGFRDLTFEEPLSCECSLCKSA